MYYDPSALQERIADLEEALKPFADLGAALQGNEFYTLFEIWNGRGNAAISMIHLKEATRVLRA